MRLSTFRFGLVLLAFTCFLIWNKLIPSNKGKKFLVYVSKNKQLFSFIKKKRTLHGYYCMTIAYSSHVVIYDFF